MIRILISSSVLILVILLLRLLLGNRISYRLRYGLWLLVAIRLLIPLDIPVSTFSVNSYTQTHMNAPVAQIVKQPVTGPSYEAIYADVRQELQALSPNLPPVQLEQQTAAETRQRITVPTVGQILQLLWIVGMILSALWFLIANLRFFRTAAGSSQPFEAGDIPLPVRISDRLQSPCLLGFLRPVIYITPACARSKEDLRNVLAHELTHRKHGDNWWALVRCICLCVYWFHPLVWAAAVLSRRDCELACDEGALKALGEDHRLEYGKTLLNIVSANASGGNLLHTATSMNESKRQLKQRIRFIASHPKRSISAIAVLILVISVAVGCTFTGAKEAPTVPTQPSTVETQPSTAPTEPTVPTQPQPSDPVVYGSYLTELSDTNFICVALPQLDNGQMHAAVLCEVNSRLEALFEGTAQPIASDTPVSVQDITKYQRSLTLDHEITYQTENLVSIVFRGMYHASDAAHPTNILFSVNLYPKTGQRIYLRNLYCIDQALYTDFCGSATQSLLAQTDSQWPESWASFSETFCDWERFRQGMYREEDFSWFCTPEGITVSYPVPHSLGDHQEVTLPFSCFRSPEDTLHPLYEIALTDYRNIVNYRLSPEYDHDNFKLPFSDELQSSLDYVYRALISQPGRDEIAFYDTMLLRAWDTMIHEMLPASQDPSISAFGYALWDINGDGKPELFWVRNDGYILAVFTVCQDQLILLGTSYSRGYLWISEEYRLAYRASGGAAVTTIALYDLKESGVAIVPVPVKGIHSDYDGLTGTESFTEMSGGNSIAISEERFYTLLEEMVNQVPITDVAAFHPLFYSITQPNSVNQTQNGVHLYNILSDEDAAQLKTLFQSTNRTPADFPEGQADCFIVLAEQPGYIYNYYSSSGTLTLAITVSYTEYDEQANPVCGKLSESDRLLVNNILSKYIELPDPSPKEDPQESKEPDSTNKSRTKYGKLIVLGQDISTEKHFVFEDENSILMLPLTTILKEFGAVIEWTEENKATIYLNGNIFYLDTQAVSVKPEDRLGNYIVCAPGGKIYSHSERDELYLDYISLETVTSILLDGSIKDLDGSIKVLIDYENQTVEIQYY